MTGVEGCVSSPPKPFLINIITEGLCEANEHYTVYKVGNPREAENSRIYVSECKV